MAPRRILHGNVTTTLKMTGKLHCGIEIIHAPRDIICLNYVITVLQYVHYSSFYNGRQIPQRMMWVSRGAKVNMLTTCTWPWQHPHVYDV